MSTVRTLGAVLAAALASAPPPAQGQDLGVDGGFNVDLVHGPVLGSGRIVGLGGANTAIASGIDSSPWNPAAFASRVPWELDSFQWEIAAGVSFPGGNDFDNDERSSEYESSTYWEWGLGIKTGAFGIGALQRNNTYAVDEGFVSLRTANIGWAYAFLDGQLVAGLAGRGAYLVGETDDRTVVDFAGIGTEIGGILALEDQRWRLGVTLRDRVRSVATFEVDPEIDARYVLPEAVVMPWEVQVGFAIQLGPRPFNRRWIAPPDVEQQARDRLSMERFGRERDQVALEAGVGSSQLPANDPYRWLPRRAGDPAWIQAEAQRRRAEDEAFEERVEEEEDRDDLALLALPRRYWLITTEVLIVGRTERGVSVETFLGQDPGQVRTAGDDVTVQVRLGVETEPWPHRLKIRAGSYLEPSRIEGGSYRPHGTFGFDFRVLTWDLFGLMDPFDVRVGATIDLAPRYTDWGIGIGFWH